MSITVLTNDKELLTTFREHTDKYADMGYPGLDPEMKPIIKKLNKIDGIVTTDCCASHPEKGSYERLYVSAIVTATGLETFANIQQKFLNNVLGDKYVMVLSGQMFFRVRFRNLGMGISQKGHVWCIAAMVKTQDDKARMLHHLERAIEYVVGDSGTGPV